MVDGALLVILNPRYLPECLLSLEQVDTAKVWIKNYTELELEYVIPQVIRETRYDYYVIVSDDVVASTDALDAVVAVLKDGRSVVTGYCNLDPISELCSLTKSPPQEPYGTVQTYDWYTLDEVYTSKEELLRTYHPSMAMTGMSREMWSRYPWQCFGRNGNYGWAADLDLSIRLHRDEIPIVAPLGSFMWHTKPNWKLVDSNTHERRALRIGKEPAEVIFDV